MSIQLHATVNFLKGKGITVSEVEASNLVAPVSRMLSDWPIGYTMLLSPFFKVTNNIMWAAMLLDLIFVSFFIFLFYLLLQKRDVPKKAIKWSMVFLAISSTPLIYTTRTGVLAICFLMIGILYLIDMGAKEKVNLGGVALNSMIFAIPSLFRYAYLPFVAIPILFFGIKWLLTKEVRFIRYATLSFVVVAFSVIGITYFQNDLVSERTYLAESVRFGFHFSNLIYFKEFLFKGLFYVKPLVDLSGENDFSVKLFFKVIGLALSFFVLIKLLKSVYKNRLSNDSNFDIITVLVILLNVSLLMFLSLKFSNLHTSTSPWTFVQETRYFLPSIIVLLIFLFKNYEDKWFYKILQLAIGFASILFIAGILRILIAGPTYNFHTKRHQDFNIIKKQLLSVKEPLVFSTEIKEIALRNLIATEGYAIFNDAVIKNFKENSFHSNSPITLVTKFKIADYLENEKLLTSIGTQKLFENNDFILVKTKIPFE